MQGWFAVIRNGEIIAAFVEYEEAIMYKRSIQKENDDIIIEKIDHRRG